MRRDSTNSLLDSGGGIRTLLSIDQKSKKTYLPDVMGKLCSAFGKDRSKIELKILSINQLV